MIDEKVSAIVLNSRDYKDKDKLVTLFTPDYGIKTIILKGVKNSNAKFKFAKEPFCFGEFVLTGNNDIKIASQVNLIDAFFDITQNYDRYFIGCKILNLIPDILGKFDINSQLFIETLKVLKELAYSSIDEKMLLCAYILKAFAMLGYKLNTTNCASCGAKFMGQMFLNLETAEIVCQDCRCYLNISISQPVHNAIKILSNCEYDKLNTVNLSQSTMQDVIKLLQIILQNRFDSKLSLLKI